MTQNSWGHAKLDVPMWLSFVRKTRKRQNTEAWNCVTKADKFVAPFPFI